MQLPKGRFGAFPPLKLSGKSGQGETGDGKSKSNSPDDTAESTPKEQ